MQLTDKQVRLILQGVRKVEEQRGLGRGFCSDTYRIRAHIAIEAALEGEGLSLDEIWKRYADVVRKAKEGDFASQRFGLGSA